MTRQDNPGFAKSIRLAFNRFTTWARQGNQEPHGPTNLESLKTRLSYADLPSLVMMYLLIIFGMLFIYSAALFSPEQTAVGQASFAFVKTQMRTTVIGTLAGLILMILPGYLYKNKTIIHTVNALMVLILVINAVFGNTVGGSTNWLTVFSVTFQPGEFVKVALIFMVAWHAAYPKDPGVTHQIFTRLIDLTFPKRIGMTQVKSQPRSKRKHLLHGFDKETAIPKVLAGVKHFHQTKLDLWALVMYVLALVIFYRLPDTGMMIVIVAVTSVLYLYIAKSALLNSLFYLGVAGIYFLLRILAKANAAKWIADGNYRRARLGIFVDPFIDPLGVGYQLIQSMVAISNGGLLGQGLGQGQVKISALPAAHTDFIFSVIGEEIGVLGLAIFLTFYLGTFAYLFWQAVHLKDRAYRAFAMAVPTLYFIQAMINIGGALSLLPLTGLTLPFISYGGSSILSLVMTMGVYQAAIINDRINQCYQSPTYGHDLGLDQADQEIDESDMDLMNDPYQRV
ncbi:TPA: FtsW/RodA/SpoVE family cell cycle protein [Streptococcus suis]